jgi:hypothetical protein
MNAALTPQKMAADVLKMLEKAVKDLPIEKRENVIRAVLLDKPDQKPKE